MSREQFLERRAALKRASLVAAARSAFGAAGFDGANMERIAAEARVSTATLYRLFPSKVALFEAVLADGMLSFQESLEAFAAVPPDRRIADLAAAYAHLLDDRHSAGILRAVFSAAPSAPEVSAAFYEQVKRVVAGAFHDAMGAAQAAGLVQKTQSAAAPVALIMGMIEHAILWRRMLSAEESDIPVAAIAAQAVEACWAAFGALDR